MAAETDVTTEDSENEEKPPLTLDVKVDKPSTCQRHVTVSVSRPDIERYFSEAFDELMPQAEVPGFRPGRAPRKLIESRFKEQIVDKVKGNLLMDSMTQVTEECDFSAISEPDFSFDAVEIPDDGPLTFEFDIEVRPEFDMPAWKGISLLRSVHEYSPEEVEERTQHLLMSQYGKLADVEAATVGDSLSLEMTFKSDDETLSSTTQTVALRPTLSFADANCGEFGELLEGAKVGDTKTAKLTVSDGVANEDLRGKGIDAEFTVKGIKRRQIPKLTEQFLQEIGGFENEGELRDVIKSELTRQFEYHQQQQLRRQITSTLTKDAQWELPPDLLRRQARRELERAVMERRSAGFNEDQIQQYSNLLQQDAVASTRQALQEHFILERIAEENTIEADSTDFDQEIALIAKQSDESPRRVRAKLEKQGQMDALRNQIIERKAIELIIEHASITKTEVNPGEDERQDVSACSHVVTGVRDEEIPEAKSAGKDTQSLREPTDHT